MEVSGRLLDKVITEPRILPPRLPTCSSLRNRDKKHCFIFGGKELAAMKNGISIPKPNVVEGKTSLKLKLRECGTSVGHRGTSWNIVELRGTSWNFVELRRTQMFRLGFSI